MLCACGRMSAAACWRQQCGRCCVGCSKHPRTLPAPGEPGSCECGQTASPQCEYMLCSSCCEGCARHPCASEPSDNSSSEDSRSLPPPGQPGSCPCGNTASPRCGDQLCGACCGGGCSYHYDQLEPEPSACDGSEEQQAEPGQPGSCECGQTASPACEYMLCASCCEGCSRHRPVELDSEDEEEEEEEEYESDEEEGDHYHHPADGATWWGGVVPGPPRCLCGQPAAVACTVQCCASCCSDVRCDRHNNPNSGSRRAQSQQQGAPAWLQEDFAMAICRMMMLQSLGGLYEDEECNCDACIARGLYSASAATAASSSSRSQAARQPSAAAAATGAGRSAAAAAATPASRSSPSGAARQPSAAAAGAGSSAVDAATAAFAAVRLNDDASPNRDQQQQQPTTNAAGPGGGGGGSTPATQSSTCVVCLDQPRSVLLLPCRHLALCGGCMQKMQRQVRRNYADGSSDQLDVKCPVCREPVASMLPGIIMP